MDCEYAGRKVERCSGVGALQASRDELDADGRIGNGSARGRSEAKRNTNRKKQRKKAHHPVNGRKFLAKNREVFSGYRGRFGVMEQVYYEDQPLYDLPVPTMLTSMEVAV